MYVISDVNQESNKQPNIKGQSSLSRIWNNRINHSQHRKDILLHLNFLVKALSQLDQLRIDYWALSDLISIQIYTISPPYHHQKANSKRQSKERRGEKWRVVILLTQNKTSNNNENTGVGRVSDVECEEGNERLQLFIWSIVLSRVLGFESGILEYWNIGIITYQNNESGDSEHMKSFNKNNEKLNISPTFP